MNERRTTDNRRLAQWRVTWLIEHSTSHQLLWCIDSEVLLMPPLRQALFFSSKGRTTQPKIRKKARFTED